MEPARTIILKLGGPTQVASIVGVHRTRVSSWQRSREGGGTGGRIPQNHVPALLDHARKRGIALNAEDFLATAPKIEQSRTIARVDRSGKRQSLQLPKEFHFRGKEVEIFRRGDEVILREKSKGLERAFWLLTSLPDDFFADGRHDPPPEPVEDL